MSSKPLKTVVFTSTLLLTPLTAAVAQTFNVADYGATGSANTGTCSGQAGNNFLTSCKTNIYDFQVGQVIHIVGAGPQHAANETPITTSAPSVTGDGTTSGHKYCYFVSIADPLEGIGAPSPTSCITDDGLNYIFASTPSYTTGTSSPTFLFYVSMDGGNWQLLAADLPANGPSPDPKSTWNLRSGISDFGQAFSYPVHVMPSAKATLYSRGGWPTNFSTSSMVSKNEDLFTTITSINMQGVVGVSDNLGSTFQTALISHDDTQAIQNAINAASQAGGGTVQFGNGTYNVQRPLFSTGPSAYPTTTTDIVADENAPWMNYAFLSVPNGSVGHIHLVGLGDSTVLQTPPDGGGSAQLFFLGNFQRPDDTLGGVITIAPVPKGTTRVTMTKPSTAAPQAGDDVLLFSGSFGSGSSPCSLSVSSAGTSAGECHYTELNTIASSSAGGSYTLQYPTSKRYGSDGLNSSFGMVKMPKTPHDIMLYNMAINTYDLIFNTGLVFGLTVDAVHVNGYVSHGAFSGGFKRDVTLKNSYWGVGRGDMGYSQEEEYDGFTNLQILNNAIYGAAPASSAGPSQQARLYSTEGTSQVTYYSNSFNNISLWFDQTTDDVINNNNFYDGVITMGVGFTPAEWDPNTSNFSYSSFGSQAAASVTKNQFTIDSTYSGSWVIRLGTFDNSTIANNVISYQGASLGAAIYTRSGSVSGNAVTVTSQPSARAIEVAPDQGPGSLPSSIGGILNNTVSASNLGALLFVRNTGVVDKNPICVSGNNPSGPIVAQSPTSVIFGCP